MQPVQFLLGLLFCHSRLPNKVFFISPWINFKLNLNIVNCICEETNLKIFYHHQKVIIVSGNKGYEII